MKYAVTHYFFVAYFALMDYTEHALSYGDVFMYRAAIEKLSGTVHSVIFIKIYEGKKVGGSAKTETVSGNLNITALTERSVYVTAARKDIYY